MFKQIPKHLFRVFINQGQKRSGVIKGPTHVQQFLQSKFATQNDICLDHGSSQSYSNASAYMDSIRTNLNGPAVILAGDHSSSIVTIPTTMSKHANTKLIWVDAHADINTPDHSPSGNTHGMPLASLTGLFQFESIPKCVEMHNVFYIGLRDVDPFEWSVIKEHNMEHVTSQDVHDNITRVIQKVIEWIGSDQTHISFDIDVADPSIAKGTGTKVDDGLTKHQIFNIIDQLKYTNWNTFEMVEVNPDLDDQDHGTSKLAAEIIDRFLINQADLQ